MRNIFWATILFAAAITPFSFGVVHAENLIDSGDVRIATPAKGDVLTRNTGYKITWDGGGEKIDILLYKCPWPDNFVDSCSFAQKIATNIDNAKQYDWTLPNVQASTLYKMVIVNTGTVTPTSSGFYLPNFPHFTVTDKPQLYFDIYPMQKGDIAYVSDAPPDHTVQLLWRVYFAKACEASGDWSGKRAFAGSDNGRTYSDYSENLGKVWEFTTYKKYTLTCIGPGGSISKTLNINPYDHPFAAERESLSWPKIQVKTHKNIPAERQVLVKWIPTQHDFNRYSLELRNHLLPLWSVDLSPGADRIAVNVNEWSFKLSEKTVAELSTMTHGKYSPDEIRQNYFIRLEAWKWTATSDRSASGYLVARGDTDTFNFLPAGKDVELGTIEFPKPEPVVVTAVVPKTITSPSPSKVEPVPVKTEIGTATSTQVVKAVAPSVSVPEVKSSPTVPVVTTSIKRTPAQIKEARKEGVISNSKTGTKSLKSISSVATSTVVTATTSTTSASRAPEGKVQQISVFSRVKTWFSRWVK